jgi:hypothetical protein
MTAAPEPPRIRKVRTSLQRQMARPGGITIDEAVERAEQGLESHRNRIMEILQAQVDLLNSLCRRRPPKADSKIYALASALVDLAGFLEIPPFYTAAYSLCEATHQMTAAKTWSWPAVEVHAHALTLILANDCNGGEAIDHLLAGLHAVVQRGAPAG